MPLHTLPDSAVRRMSVLDWAYRSSPHRSREVTVWCRKIGNPRAEKVLQHRLRQNNVSEPALVAGVGDHWQGTLTITGSNARLGAEMPMALSLFSND